MAGRPGYLHLSFYWTEVRWSKFINIWKQATWTVQYIVSQLPVIATCVCVWVPAPNTLRSWLVAKLVFLMRSNKRLILLLEYKVFLTGQKCNKLCWSLSLCSTTGHSKSHSQQKGNLPLILKLCQTFPYIIHCDFKKFIRKLFWAIRMLFQ